MSRCIPIRWKAMSWPVGGTTNFHGPGGEPPCRSSPDVEFACPRDVSLRRRLPRIFRPLPGSGPSRSGSSQRQGLDGTASGARRNCRYDHRRRLCRFLRVGTHRQGIPASCVEPSFRLGGILWSHPGGSGAGSAGRKSPHPDRSDPDRAEPGHCRMPRIYLRILL